jgi:hypothetical protein
LLGSAARSPPQRSGRRTVGRNPTAISSGGDVSGMVRRVTTKGCGK